jgi:polysaccharide biosynthesis/export protein PslD
MTFSRRHLMLGLVALPLAACGGVAVPRMSTPLSGPETSRGFPDIPFADWTDAEPEYVLYPNDEIEVATPTAPELTRTLKVGPDGRISLPLLGQVMAADRTLAELEQDVSYGYASQLVRPVVEITLKQAGPIRVWVDGEVRTPGVYEMTGDIDAYQAVIQAGGFLPTARTQEVALIRRGPGGRRMLRVLDLRPRRGMAVAVRRGDVIFVPRSTLGELANFFTQIRNALPIGFNYTINGQYQQF